jgi:hypothetical protein
MHFYKCTRTCGASKIKILNIHISNIIIIMNYEYISEQVKSHLVIAGIFWGEIARTA